MKIDVFLANLKKELPFIEKKFVKIGVIPITNKHIKVFVDNVFLIIDSIEIYKQYFIGKIEKNEENHIKFVNSLPFLKSNFEKIGIIIIFELFYLKNLSKNLFNLNNKNSILFELLLKIDKITIKSDIIQLFTNKANQEITDLKSQWLKINEKLISKKKQNQNLIEENLKFSFNSPPNSMPKKMLKESALIYNQNYSKMIENNPYKLVIQENSDAKSLKSQNYSCFLCKKSISFGLYLIGNSTYFCHFYNKYCCESCFSQVKSLIPKKVQYDFDFKLYGVSKKAFREINQNYDQPLIKINHTNELIINEKSLYDCLLLKRELHLMFDCICDNSFFANKLKTEGNLHFILKENFFSLRNLYDIKSGKLKNQLENLKFEFFSHIKECNLCRIKKNICLICEKNEILYFFEILDTKVCKTCKNVYHEKCFREKGCSNCNIKALLSFTD